MTGYDVDGNDMLPTDPLDEAAVEAFLSGHRRPGGSSEPLAAFAQDVDVVVTGPAPAPTGNLAALLRDGFVPQGATNGAWGPAAAPVPPSPAMPEAWVPAPLPPAPPPDSPVRGAPGGRRSLRLLPRLAGLGLAAKVGLGLGVAAASVTGAGAAGVLPDPAQEVVGTVIDAVTPFDLPDPSPGRSGTGPRRGGAGTTNLPGSGGNGITGDVEGPDGVGVGGPAGTPVGPSAGGATGLGRANETPAAGNVPTSVPVPTTTASPGQKGHDRAGETPAADRLPTTTTTTLAP